MPGTTPEFGPGAWCWQCWSYPSPWGHGPGVSKFQPIFGHEIIGGSINGGSPIAGWFISWKILLKYIKMGDVIICNQQINLDYSSNHVHGIFMVHVPTGPYINPSTGKHMLFHPPESSAILRWFPMRSYQKLQYVTGIIGTYLVMHLVDTNQHIFRLWENWLIGFCWNLLSRCLLPWYPATFLFPAASCIHACVAKKKTFDYWLPIQGCIRFKTINPCPGQSLHIP